MTAIDMDPLEEVLMGDVARALLALAHHKEVEEGAWMQFSTFFRVVGSNSVDMTAVTLLEQEPKGRVPH